MKSKKVKNKAKEKVDYKAKEKLKYICVYGIINSNIEVNMEGLKNEPIEKIKFRDVWVLTSPYPNLHPLIEDKEVMQYAEILKKIVEKTTVIPMSFGTVFKDQEILEGVLSKSYDLLKSTFIIIDNKIELGIKVLKKPDEDANEKLIPEILEPLKKLSIKSLEGDKFSDRLLLNYSFLVEKSRFSEFSEKIAELEMSNKDLKFVYTGPWPPYSFVNIKIAGGS